MAQDSAELPEWVQTLVEAEKTKAYGKGWDDGHRHALSKVADAVERMH